MQAIGCVLAELKLKDVFISKGNTSQEQIINIFKVFGTPKDSMWSRKYGQYTGQKLDEKFDINFLKFLECLMHFNPEKRASADELIKHRFIES